MEASWRKPRRSEGAHNCVEVSLGRVVKVRDSKNREAGHIEVEPHAWSAFLGLTRRGRVVSG
ncbi:DUF397 domain-containing protein [Amycolatopsis anabasis]|uniref:DUF397 domain-containing protein n=1 Tax=Amycolatopsis anabasis TaxID=1840409 RepID=UPI00131D8171|nr:DUF397 domain-containing protein [Amycolatopsis anabasis]